MIMKIKNKSIHFDGTRHFASHVQTHTSNHSALEGGASKSAASASSGKSWCVCSSWNAENLGSMRAVGKLSIWIDLTDTLKFKSVSS